MADAIESYSDIEKLFVVHLQQLPDGPLDKLCHLIGAELDSRKESHVYGNFQAEEELDYALG